MDCANGACYKVSPDVFTELGAEIIPIGVTPDGYNINAKCGSTYPELVKEEVLKQRADFGISLDGDGDRVILIDEKGDVLKGEELIFIFANYYLKNKSLRKKRIQLEIKKIVFF